MKTITRIVTKGLFGIVAALFLVAGASILLVNTGLLPAAVKQVVVEESQGNLQTLHVAQELGTLLAFSGLITLWFLWHYKQSQFFHWSITIFWGLLALVHWIDVRGPVPDLVGNLVTSIPFVLFAAIGLVRAAVERSAKCCSQGDG
ncbi:MAG TPA: hypothetical protein VFB96_07660 [Pirellulaceae bacterium]|nr:hypothetical protein [Pirellulaceae bacterium]